MSRYLDLDTIQNPYGKRIGGGYSTVLVGGGGGRTHIKGDDGGPLCMQGRRTQDLRSSGARVVTCYRCIKIMGLQSNAPALERTLYQRDSDMGQSANYMVPGGRQGSLVADKKASPYGMDGKTVFRRGTKKHPTQSRLGAFGDNVSTREGRRSGTSRVRGGVARPMGYVAPSFAAEADVSRYASTTAKRRSAQEQVVARRARVREEAMEAAVMEMEERVAGYANNPYRGAERKPKSQEDREWEMIWSEVGPTYSTREYAAYKKKMAAGGRKAASREGWEKHQWEMARRRQAAGVAAREEQLAGYAEEGGAAEAMRLYHSGQARPLKEAWAMVKGTSLRRANGRR